MAMLFQVIPSFEYSSATSSPESASSQAPEELPNFILKDIFPPPIVLIGIVRASLAEPAK